MSLSVEKLKTIVEAALMASDAPLNIKSLQALFEEHEMPSNEDFKAVFESLEQDCKERGYQLKQVASGWRFQVREELAPWVGRLWEEKPQRYTRALLETLALIAYRQPITRGEIEEVRGVSVSSNIIRTLTEREWVRVVGHRDVPGRPAMYATTKQFLDYFNLNSLDRLPSLAEIKSLDEIAEKAETALAEALEKVGLTAEDIEQHKKKVEAAESFEKAQDDVEKALDEQDAAAASEDQEAANIEEREPLAQDEISADEEELVADQEPSAEQEPLADQESSTEQEPSAELEEELSANGKVSAENIQEPLAENIQELSTEDQLEDGEIFGATEADAALMINAKEQC